MEPFEVVVHGEVFRISENYQPGGALSYDFLWLNGPGDGTYGFAVSRSSTSADGDPLISSLSMTRSELTDEVTGFVEGFYEPGGIGEDFPDRAPGSPHSKD